MKNFIRYLFWVGSVLSVATFCSNTGMSAALDFLDMPEDSDEITLPYPIRDRHGDLYAEPEPTSPLFMGNPSNIKQSVEYDPENNRYNINENMGELFYRNPSYLSFDEFVDREFKKSTRNYWRQRATEEDKLNQKVFSQKIQVKSVVFDRIFGGNTIDIRPQGSAELTFGIRVNKTGNPAVPEEQRSVTSFDFVTR